MSLRWLSAALLVAPGSAFAGIGMSYSPPSLGAHVLTGGLGGGLFGGGGANGIDFGGGIPNYTYMPTLDLRMDQADLQFHILDLLATAGASDFDNIVLGANGYYHVVQTPLPGKGKITFDPGVQVDLGTYGGDALVQVLVAGRAGVEVGEGKSGLGIYAIPDLGISLLGDASGAVFGGTMGFSVWY